MTPHHKRKTRLRGFIQALASGRDLALILADFGLSHSRAHRMLESADGRREMQRVRDLCAAQRSLILHQISPQAMNALTSALNSEKPDPRIKSALNLLELTRDDPDLDDF